MFFLVDPTLFLTLSCFCSNQILYFPNFCLKCHFKLQWSSLIYQLIFYFQNQFCLFQLEIQVQHWTKSDWIYAISFYQFDLAFPYLFSFALRSSSSSSFGNQLSWSRKLSPVQVCCLDALCHFALNFGSFERHLSSFDQSVSELQRFC